MGLEKIITGNGDGVERAARDVALNLRIGWMGGGEGWRRVRSKGYQHGSAVAGGWGGESKATMEARMQLADGLLILSRGENMDRINHYRQLALKHRRKLLHVDLSHRSMTEGAGLICSWIAIQHLSALQVTGPDETIAPGIYQQTKRVLTLALIESIVGLEVDDSPYDLKTATSVKRGNKIPASVGDAADELIEDMSLKECVMIARLAEDELVQLKMTLGIIIQDKLRYWMSNESFRKRCLDGLKLTFWDDYAVACQILKIIRYKLIQTHRLRLVK